MDLIRKAECLGQMHRGPGVLVLPNAWDALSARLCEVAGFSAIATTSAGIAWAHGFWDGGPIPVDEVIHALRVIVRSVGVPVTADIENGYADTAEGVAEVVAEVVRRVMEAGVAGVNLEDAPGPDASPLTDRATHEERIAAVRAAADATGIPLVVNARTDVFWRAVGPPESRLDEAAERLNAYLAAGADCAFAPGVRDAQTIAELSRRVRGPLNVLAGPGSPTVPELARLGVARVSVGSGPVRAAMAMTRQVMHELRGGTGYAAMADAIPYAEAQRLFGAPSA